MKRLLMFLTLASISFAQIPDGSTLVSPSRPLNPTPAPTASVKPAAAVSADAQEDLASLQADIKTLTLRVEDLERKNEALSNKLSSADSGTYATKEELKLSEGRTHDAIAAESQKVQSAILDEIKAAKASVAPRTALPTPQGPDFAPAAPTAAATPAPARTSSKLTSPATDAEKAAFMKQGVRHTVVAGDSLSSIARQYHSTMRGIVVANSITNPDRLLVGSELFIPTKE